MSRYNNNYNLRVLSVLFFAVLGFQNSSLATSKKLVKYNRHHHEASLNYQAEIDTLNKQSKSNVLLSDLSLDSFTGKNPEDKSNTQNRSSLSELVRKIALIFFLLLFLPFGLFYPFFLFYKKLLEVNQTDKLILEDLEPSLITSAVTIEDDLSEIDEEQIISVNEAEVTFSQLQIAFYPESSNFKQQLKLIDSSRDRNASEMMHKTISLLITQQDWTHASYDSRSTSLIEAKERFEAVLVAEKNKYVNRQLSLVNAKKQTSDVETSSHSHEYKYTVVTMLFCTSSDYHLSANMTSKEDLAEQLIKLSTINREDIIKFELLWNPQREGEFLSNEELLTNYGQLMRLF